MYIMENAALKVASSIPVNTQMFLTSKMGIMTEMQNFIQARDYIFGCFYTNETLVPFTSVGHHATIE
jgi:hypothetical protein